MSSCPLKISEVEIIPLRAKHGLIGIASVVLNDAVHLACLAIYTRPDGIGVRLVYPTKSIGEGKSVPVYYPIRREVGLLIEGAVAEKVRKLVSQLVEEKETNQGGSDESRSKDNEAVWPH